MSDLLICVDRAELAAAIRENIAEQAARQLPADVRRNVVRQMTPVSKGAEEKRFLLGLAYQAGRDRRIKKGADGGRDTFTPEELEKACWSFLPGGGQIGIAHLDGTLGHMTVTENYIYRGPDWEQPSGLVIKSGMAWLIGGICDQYAWGLAKARRVNGFSPQGGALRRAIAAEQDGVTAGG
jgi:hypothetical protein